MLRYAITDRRLAGGSLRTLRQRAAQLHVNGIDFLLVREKDLPAGELTILCRAIREVCGTLKVLVSSRVDVALAAGLAGVHLSSHPDELTPAQVRRLYSRAGLAAPVVSKSCHSVAEVWGLRRNGPDLVLFAPVFGKVLVDGTTLPGVGLPALAEACRAAGQVSVLALGGVTEANAASCLAAGAAGIAGIRLFL